MWCSVWVVVGCVLLFVVVYVSEIMLVGISEIIVEVFKFVGIFMFKLEMIIYKLVGDGLFLFIVFNYGKVCGKVVFQVCVCYSEQVVVLVVCGYVVVILMWQGFFKFGGVYIGSGCNVEVNGIIQVEDVVVVFDYMIVQLYVDCNCIVVMGQLYGGLIILVFGIIVYFGVCGLVNFVGGLCNDICVDWEGNFVCVFEMYGCQLCYFLFWFYGDNDSYWFKLMFDRMFVVYISVGGKGWLVDFGNFKSDLYGMFVSYVGFVIWLLQVDVFLCEFGLLVGLV